MLGGVLQICGVIALLIGASELLARLLPRRLVDEMREIVGDVPAPRHDPVDAARRRGAL